MDVGGAAFLLVLASAWLFDTLATFNAQAENREAVMEDDPDEGEEDDRSDFEPDHDNEYDYRDAPRELSPLWQGPSDKPDRYLRKPVPAISPDGKRGVFVPVR